MRRVATSLLTAAPLEFAARCMLAGKRRFLPAGRWSTAQGTRETPAATGPRMSPESLADALADLRIYPGDAVMVHSSFEALSPIGWTPGEILDFLQHYLGSDGLLAMPSHPKLADRDGRLVYDVRRSPSTVGLLSELFRRRPNVLRSECPASAVAALGSGAAELLNSHAASFAPHDELSPYARLAERNGKVLCLGARPDRMTILHVAEDAFRAHLNIPNFYERREVIVRNGDRERTAIIHARAGWLWWYLNLRGWSAGMERKGLLRAKSVAGKNWYSANARDTVSWMEQEIRRGRSIYPLAHLNRWLRLGTPPRETAE